MVSTACSKARAVFSVEPVSNRCAPKVECDESFLPHFCYNFTTFGTRFCLLADHLLAARDVDQVSLTVEK